MFGLCARLFLKRFELLFRLGAHLRDLRFVLADLFLRAFEGFHLFEHFGFEFGDVLARGVGFADGGGVFLFVRGRHQSAVGVFGFAARLGDLGFEAGAFGARGVAAGFDGAKFKSALLELFFDLSAPLWNGV